MFVGVINYEGSGINSLNKVKKNTRTSGRDQNYFSWKFGKS